MKEVICIHIGQAGVQIGDASWQLFCKEHELSADGKPTSAEFNLVTEQNRHNFFSETDEGAYKARSLFIDSEPSVVDQFRKSKHSGLFSSWQLVSGKEDASNIMPRGRSMAYQSNEDLIDRIRKLAEDCSLLQGFMIFNSAGGGTGTGFGSSIITNLVQSYAKKAKIGFTVWPSPKFSNTVVEPYNAALSMLNLMKNQDLTFMFDNEALYSLCRRRLNIENPYYDSINTLIAQAVSGVTASFRVNSGFFTSVHDLKESLCLNYPSSFAFTSCAPLLPSQEKHSKPASIEEITNTVFDEDNIMVKCNMKKTKYIGISTQYRGLLSPKSINEAVIAVKKNRKIEFIKSKKTAFKVGLNLQPCAVSQGSELAASQQSVCMTANNTGIAQVISREREKIEMLNNKGAFWQWFYGEGLDKGEIGCAIDELRSVETSYQSYENSSLSSGKKDLI